MSSTQIVRRVLGRCGALAFLALSLNSPATAGVEELTVRVNDAISEPGGLVAIVLRTYASRSAGQGQVCLSGRQSAEGTDQPFTDLEGMIVFSDLGDATASGSFDPLTGEIIISFESPSATINATGGVLLVAYMRLDPTIPAGTTIDLVMDLPGSFLVDENGDPIPLVPRYGLLTIRPMGAPTPFAADGDEIPAGTVADIGAETFEAFAISSGQATLLYDPSLAAGEPVVTMDPRHGRSIFSTDTSIPGRVSVTFTSDDATLNAVPGEIISILLPIAADVPDGTYPLTFDPTETFLLGSGGVPVSIVLEPGTIEVGVATIFADGFESGDLGEWSLVAP